MGKSATNNYGDKTQISEPKGSNFWSIEPDSQNFWILWRPHPHRTRNATQRKANGTCVRDWEYSHCTARKQHQRVCVRICTHTRSVWMRLSLSHYSKRNIHSCGFEARGHRFLWSSRVTSGYAAQVLFLLGQMGLRSRGPDCKQRPVSLRLSPEISFVRRNISRDCVLSLRRCLSLTGDSLNLSASVLRKARLTETLSFSNSELSQNVKPHSQSIGGFCKHQTQNIAGRQNCHSQHLSVCSVEYQRGSFGKIDKFPESTSPTAALWCQVDLLSRWEMLLVLFSFGLTQWNSKHHLRKPEAKSKDLWIAATLSAKQKCAELLYHPKHLHSSASIRPSPESYYITTSCSALKF